MTHPALATMVEAAEAGDVSREQAIQFLEGACRNWSKVQRLSEDDISDVATELTRFSSRRSATANILSLAQYVKGLEEALKPFADCADHYAKPSYCMDELVVHNTTWSSDGTTTAKLSRGDFARAADALSGGKP